MNISPNSSIAGYLRPATIHDATILEDKQLDRFLHDLFVGISGMDPTTIRPRWLATPGNLVSNGELLLAHGITKRRDDVVAHQEFRPDIGMIINRNQEFDVLCTFYGADCATYEGIIRDGLSLDQNREYINSQGIVLVAVGNPRNASEFINNNWVKRIDVEITFRRRIRRIYPVLTLLASDIDIHYDCNDHEIIQHIKIDE